MSSEATTTASRYHPLRVRAVIDETHDTKSIVFDVPEALAEQFSYKPGQFLTLRLPIEGRFVPRCYSMSSAPELDDALRVTVKRVHQGRGSNWVCDKVRVGDTIELMPPSGLFSPRNLGQNFLLLAGAAALRRCFPSCAPCSSSIGAMSFCSMPIVTSARSFQEGPAATGGRVSGPLAGCALA